MSNNFSKEVEKYLIENYMYIYVFIGEISARLDLVNTHLGSLNEQLKLIEKKDFNSEVFWASIYGFTGSAAQISMILKPSKNAKPISKKRGEILRMLLNISDKHEILNRALRNRFVHIDEDIDKWWLASKSRNILRRGIFSPGSIVGLEPTDIFEQYDPYAKIFYYRGQPYNIELLSTAVKDIRGRIEVAEGKLQPYCSTWVEND